MWNAYDYVYNINNGDRLDAPNIVIVISDGNSTKDKHLLTNHANYLQQIAEVWAIGKFFVLYFERIMFINNNKRCNPRNRRYRIAKNC